MDGKDYNVRLKVKKDGEKYNLHELAVVKQTGRGGGHPPSSARERGLLPADHIQISEYIGRVKRA